MRYRAILISCLTVMGLLAAGTQSAAASTDFAERIASEVDDALAVRSTLVVWLIDRAESSQPLRTQVLSGLSVIYRTRDTDIRREGGPPAHPLMSVVISFGREANFLIREPTESYENVWKAMDGIRDSKEMHPAMFAAV